MNSWKPLDIPKFTTARPPQDKNADKTVELKTINEAQKSFDAGYQAGIEAANIMASKNKAASVSPSIQHQINFSQIQKRLADIQQRLMLPFAGETQGTITQSLGLLLEARGIKASIGNLCHILLPDRLVSAVITGFKEGISYLMPLEAAASVVPGCSVLNTGQHIRVPVGEALLGRVIDGLGRPLDNLGELGAVAYESLEGLPINPMHRQPINKALEVGIKAIDGLFTLGRGQKMGLFATSGLGKSVLLGMIARYTTADVVVIGLVGERGREVRDFIDYQFGKSGLKKLVVVATPADETPMMRVNGAFMAMRIASSFSASGKHVLVLMDSLSRVADAQREVALSMGEPIGLKGYPPSVFQRLAQLVEIAGCFGHQTGSVTALFTVLAQDERVSDPVASAARAVLDGHIVLSREYAEQGRYPAIDIESSVSRVMRQVVDKAQYGMARQFRRWHALYRENKDLIGMGAYAPGANSEADMAIQKNQAMEDFLRQDETNFFNKEETKGLLAAVLEVDLKKQEAQP
jgi:flagellum-specific ATP synthase